MKTILKSIAATFILATSATSIKPLGETTAQLISLAGSGAVGAGSGALTYYAIDTSMQNPAKAIVSGAVGAGAGGLSYFFLSSLLYNFTPPGKVLNAAKKIRDAESDYFLSQALKNEKDLAASAAGHFGGSWPIIKTREHLTTLSEKLDSAHTNLTSALSEASGNSRYIMLCKRCKELLPLISPLKSKISEKLAILVSNKDYKFQVALYEKHQEAERQRAHESRLKREDRRHDRSERNKDRDLERYKLKHDSKERQKDRNFIGNENNKDRLHGSLENYLDRELQREVFN